MELFKNLPEFPPALPDDELRLLAWLPEWPTTIDLDESDHAACRRLEKKGLVKVRRLKLDPIAVYPTWGAGKLPAILLVK